MLQLNATIKVVRNGVIQERALLKVWELNGLRREVKVLCRASAATDRLPWAGLLDALGGLQITSARVPSENKGVRLTFVYPRTWRYLKDGLGSPCLVNAAK